MEMVSASKMRRAQLQASGSRPYARKLQEVLKTISALSDGASHPLLNQPETGRDVVVLVSTDKSLAGSLNTNLFRQASEFIEANYETKPDLIIVGAKARQFAKSYEFNLIADYSNIADPVSYGDSLPISSAIMNGFLDGSFKSVRIIYMDFVSTLLQKFRVDQILPVPTDLEMADESSNVDGTMLGDYTFEPSAKNILDWLLPYYVEMAVYQILLEAKASEHSARMVAMKNASENATEVIASLKLEFNRTRQAMITNELLDITTASITAVQN